MDHRIYRVQSVEVTAPYTLLVHFDDDTAQIINFNRFLQGSSMDRFVISRCSTK